MIEQFKVIVKPNSYCITNKGVKIPLSKNLYVVNRTIGSNKYIISGFLNGTEIPEECIESKKQVPVNEMRRG
jgi:hypothetical protein